jgi:hypothetical protein
MLFREALRGTESRQGAARIADQRSTRFSMK